MKKVTMTIITLVLTLGTLLSCTCLTGCERITPPEPAAVSFVIRVGGCVPVSDGYSAFYDDILAAAFHYQHITAVTVEGSPRVAVDVDVNPPTVEGDLEKRMQVAKQNTNAILSMFNNETLRAQTDEADTLKAICMAADALSTASPDMAKRLLIQDSGLSTAGLLPFNEYNIFETDISYIVDKIKEMDALPRVEGVDIYWRGLGQTEAPQPVVTQSNVLYLENLWSAILTAGGGKVHFDRSPIAAGKVLEGLPNVSIVPIVQEPIFDADDVIPSGSVVRLPSECVNFIGDSDEFIDPDKALRTLQPFANYLNAHPDVSILICGSIASVGGGPNAGLKLSLARANACKTVLEDMGVDSAQIACIGVGRRPTSLRVPDLDSHGNLIEDKAKLNRAVYILRDTCELADELRKVAEA